MCVSIKSVEIRVCERCGCNVTEDPCEICSGEGLYDHDRSGRFFPDDDCEIDAEYDAGGRTVSDG